MLGPHERSESQPLPGTSFPASVGKRPLILDLGVGLLGTAACWQELGRGLDSQAHRAPCCWDGPLGVPGSPAEDRGRLISVSAQRGTSGTFGRQAADVWLGLSSPERSPALSPDLSLPRQGGSLHEGGPALSPQEGENRGREEDFSCYIKCSNQNGFSKWAQKPSGATAQMEGAWLGPGGEPRGPWGPGRSSRRRRPAGGTNGACVGGGPWAV